MIIICVHRKERNRMHAKLTRDRKKLFTTQLQQAISSLERKNAILRNRLQSLTPGSTVDTDTDVQSGTTVSSFKTDSRSSDGSITSCSASPNRNYTSNGHKRSKLNNANAGVIIG